MYERRPDPERLRVVAAEPERLRAVAVYRGLSPDLRVSPHHLLTWELFTAEELYSPEEYELVRQHLESGRPWRIAAPGRQRTIYPLVHGIVRARIDYLKEP